MKGMELAGTLAAGRPHPLGAHLVDGGTNFSVWSRTAGPIDLLLFDDGRMTIPSNVIRLEPTEPHLSLLARLRPGPPAGPGLRVPCPRAVRPDRGLRFDAEKVLLDRTGRAVAVPGGYDRDAATGPATTRHPR